MRALKILLSAATASIVYARGTEAPVYIFDGDSNPSIVGSQPPTLSPSTAKLLLAHRLGLSEHDYLQNANELTLQLLNRMGGAEQPLFSKVRKDQQKLLFVVDGVEDTANVFDDSQKPAFTIATPPPSSSTAQEIRDLLRRDMHRRWASKLCTLSPSEKYKEERAEWTAGGFAGSDYSGTCDRHMLSWASTIIDTPHDTELDVLKEIIRRGSSLSESTTIIHVSLLEKIAYSYGPKDSEYSRVATVLKNIIAQLREQFSDQSSTFVFIPLTPKDAKSSTTWYSSLDAPRDSHSRRQAQAEEPLSGAHSPAYTPPVSQDSRSHQQQASQSSTLRKATLPICHSSKTSCMSVTGNCSSHGSCYKKYTGRSDDGAGTDCWACDCTKSIRQNADGSNKTTYWGGPACSKKDVSAPFLLLAGFTVAMVAVLTWGVGLMYSIGQEDLPSVIGAGVAGPRAQQK